MHIADTKAQAIKDVEYGLREFCDYLQHTASVPQLLPVGNSIGEYIEWAMSTGAAVIGTYKEAIEQIENLQHLSNGCFLLFDHNWANWAAKKHHHELFGDYVIPHFKKTNRRLKISETATRAVRDELAAAQMAAISDFAAKHAAPVKDAAAAAEQEGHSDDRAD